MKQKNLVGYCRVSTLDQNLDRQIDALQEYGIKKRNIYEDKITGTKKDRPGLNKLLLELEPEDVVVVLDLTRLSRSTRDLLIIVQLIKDRGAAIKSLKDTWLDTTSDNPYNEFLLTVMSALSQLERDLISQRIKEGLESARRRGRVGGRPNKRNDKAPLVTLMLREGHTIKEIQKATSLGRTTIYRIKDDLEKG